MTMPAGRRDGLFFFYTSRPAAVFVHVISALYLGIVQVNADATADRLLPLPYAP